MTARPKRPWLRVAAMTATALAGFAIYFYGAFNAPVLDPDLAARKAYLDRVIRTDETDPATERALADAYWGRYPDVAEDAYFGRLGKLGLEGARAHFERHGRTEGRVWGLEK
jgi:hypothetical protein